MKNQTAVEFLEEKIKAHSLDLLPLMFIKQAKEIEKKQKSCCSIPKGWYVAEAGQDELHLLWFVVLVNFDDVLNHVEKPRHFIAEECDSFEQALKECLNKLQ
jgi:hypothetical protein